MSSPNQVSGQSNWQKKREKLYNQLIKGAAAVKKLQEIAKEYREPAQIEEAKSKLESYLTDNQSEILYETSERLKSRLKTAKEFYEGNIEHETKKGELENSRDFLIDLDIANVHVKDVELNSYGLNMSFGPLMWKRLNHFLTGNNDMDIGGKALQFYWNPKENKYSLYCGEVTPELSLEDIDSDGDLEEELNSHEEAKELGIYFVHEESELSQLLCDSFNEKNGGEVPLYSPGSRNPKGTRKHEDSHLFQALFPFEPESGITTKASELKKGLKNEAIAYLINGHEYNIFLDNNYKKERFVEDQIKRMTEEDREKLEHKLQKKLDRQKRVKEGELPSIGPFQSLKEEIGELESQLEKVEDHYQELNQIRVANKEAVHKATNHIPKDILAEIVRNIDYDKIHKRIPELVEVYEKRRENSRYTTEIEEIMNLELSN